MKDSQTIKKKAKIPRVIDEGWNSQKQLSGPVEKRNRRGKPLYPHPKFSLGLRFSIGLYSKVDIACKKNGVLD